MVNVHQLIPHIIIPSYTKLYPQNGDRIVTIDSMTSFHPMYTTEIKHDCNERALTAATINLDSVKHLDAWSFCCRVFILFQQIYRPSDERA